MTLQKPSKLQEFGMLVFIHPLIWVSWLYFFLFGPESTPGLVVIFWVFGVIVELFTLIALLIILF